MSAYKDRKYAIAPYDPNWLAQFEAEAARIRAIFGNDLRIEHIGSTAVPGMAGKNCIDVLVIVDDLLIVQARVAEMQAAGYMDAGEFVRENSRLFRKMNGNEVLANIHFFPKDHPHVREMLALRDHLRSHPEEVKEYSKLKEALYQKYADDYGAYRKEKDAYMAQLMRRAMQSSFPSSIQIEGTTYSRVDVQHSGKGAIYKNDKDYLRIGERQKIARDLAMHKKMEGLGLPVPHLLGEGEWNDLAYFKEESLGEKHLADLFIADFKKNNAIQRDSFEKLLAISLRFAEAQLKTATQEKDWEAFRSGVHLQAMYEELPGDKAVLQKAYEVAEAQLADLPFVITHGDFTPFNVYPKGVIDFEYSFMAPAGYDLATMVQHLDWFPESKEYEMHQLYNFTAEQKEEYIAQIDSAYEKNGVPKLSNHLAAFNFVKGLWHAAHMQHTPKLQQFRYDLLRKSAQELTQGN